MDMIFGAGGREESQPQRPVLETLSFMLPLYNFKAASRNMCRVLHIIIR
jgi:hypothetical protein